MKRHYRIALVGNPNCGKTTIINALTGSRLQVGNWPGVTVERKSGYFESELGTIEVIDLPGTYSLSASLGNKSLDEQIACDFILNESVDLLINVIDAANLERNLFLTTQLFDMGVPMIIALNMMDVAKTRGMLIDPQQLSAMLNCPVIPLISNKTISIIDFKKQIIRALRHQQRPEPCVQLPAPIERAISTLSSLLQTMPQQYDVKVRSLALSLLEEDQTLFNTLSNSDQKNCIHIRKELAETIEDLDLTLADVRYTYVHELTQQVVKRREQHARNTTRLIDKIVLNRWLGLPIFFAVMYMMFLFAINIGGVFQNFFDISTETIFVQGLGHVLHALGINDWLVALIASGIGKGINTTVTFIPVISAMFFFLAFLEGSGYMARAAFVMDRFMQFLGLPGKSFVPMIVGFGCNVPAIMATRTLDSARDRILTALMAPFISCSARLAIFAVFTAAFFPTGGQNVVFSLYLIGILMAVLTGWLLRKTVLPGRASPFIMEMPSYHWPSWRALFGETWARLKGFILRAGKLIVPICLLIGTLNAVTFHGLNQEGASSDSILSLFGQWLTPLFAPMGIHQDNWPATVGLLTGTLAKEVVIATLNTLYTQVGHLAHGSIGGFDFWGQLKTAWQTIPDNIRALPDALSNPVLASAPEHSVTPGVYGVMAARFTGQASAFAYLLFVLLYVPCASTIAVLSKEIGRSWSIFSLFWSTGLAYSTAVIFYQIATYHQHPLTTFWWIVIIITLFSALLISMRFCLNRQHNHCNQKMVTT